MKIYQLTKDFLQFVIVLRHTNTNVIILIQKFIRFHGRVQVNVE